MSYERGFGGSAPLFNVDGTTIIGTNTDYTDPRALNPRLRSALQILSDLGLLRWDTENGYEQTPEGKHWLSRPNPARELSMKPLDLLDQLDKGGGKFWIYCNL